MDRLTNQNYWENYYKNSVSEKSQIERIVSEYDKYWELLVKCNQNVPPKDIIEIGGYPGRYLAYLGCKYNLVPTSLDYNSDISKIKEVMSYFDVKEFDIIQADIFNYKPIKQFDIVFSNGFIEHFDDYNEVLNKHLSYLKNGGTLLVMVPNKRWLRKWYGYLVDYKNLKSHNLKSMRKKVFIDFAYQNGLELLSLEYFGGFSYTLHHKPNIIQKIIYKMVRFIFIKLNPYIKSKPNRYFSSVLIAVFRK
jgi:SAM-dependent methyltransferase